MNGARRKVGILGALRIGGVRYQIDSEAAEEVTKERGVLEVLNPVVNDLAGCRGRVCLRMAPKRVLFLHQNHALAQVTETDRRICSSRTASDDTDVAFNDVACVVAGFFQAVGGCHAQADEYCG